MCGITVYTFYFPSSPVLKIKNSNAFCFFHVSFASSRFLWLLKTLATILGLASVVFVVRSVFLTAELSTFKRETPKPALVDPVLKLLPEEHLRKLFTYSDVW